MIVMGKESKPTRIDPGPCENASKWSSIFVKVISPAVFWIFLLEFLGSKFNSYDFIALQFFETKMLKSCFDCSIQRKIGITIGIIKVNFTVVVRLIFIFYCLADNYKENKRKLLMRNPTNKF